MDVLSQYQYTKRQSIDGGQGQNSIGVFRAFDPQLQREVAVKEIAKASFRNPTEFFAEAQAMFKSDHPNVVPIRVASQTNDRICLSMPYFRNGSLSARIAVNPLPLRDVLTIGREILAGLGAIHAGGSIHFDIKPSNVLFSDQNVAMIADFGQAREVGPNGITLMPSRMYAPCTPPEAIANSGLGTTHSDIYQVAVTLYRALNGEPAFDRQLTSAAQFTLGDEIVSGRFPKRSVFLPHVPDQICRIIRKAMNVNPAKRYSNAADFSNALARVSIGNNWNTVLGASGGVQWTSTRPSQPAIRVELTPDGTKWDVSIHTLTNSAPRKARTSLWKRGVTRVEADKHLSQLFATLG